MFRDTGKDESGWASVLTGGLSVLAHEGKWEISGLSLSVDALDGGGAWLCLTDRDIENFEFKTSMTAVTGGNASIFFRQHAQGAKCYEFDLKCEQQKVIVTKFNRNDKKQRRIISAVNYELTPGRDYDVEIAVRGESITTYLDGKLVNEVRDADYPSGGICLTAWKSKTRFQDPCLRIF